MKKFRSERTANQFSILTGAAILLATLLFPALAFCGGVVTNPTEAALNAALAGGGTVTFACNGTITITSSKSITTNTVLDATGYSVAINGGHSVQLFMVSSGASLTLANLTLANGFTTTNGGAIYNSGSVSAYNCIFTNNLATGTNGNNGAKGNDSTGNFGGAGQNGGDGGNVYGAAIYNLGTLAVTTCEFLINQATGGAGGSGGTGGSGYEQGGNGGNGGAGGIAWGGAIFSTNNVTITDCYFWNNVALAGNAGGGGSGGSGGFGDQYPGNSGFGGVGGEGSGGGTYSDGNSTIVGSTFYVNFAQGGSSGADGVTNARQQGYTGQTGGNSYGGGLCNLGTNSIINCSFCANQAAGGAGGTGSGGYYGGKGGTGGSGFGGGLYSSFNAGVTNCTFAGGSAYGGAGGQPGPNRGGGNLGTGSGGGAYGGCIAMTGGTVTLKNSIFAYSSHGANGYGSFVDAGNNISSDGSLGLTATNSHNNLDPLLASVAYNGGYTPTCALMSNSPAINAADSSAAPLTDQRGYYRTYAPDIGAYEYNGSPVNYDFVNVQAVGPYAVEGTSIGGTFSITRTGKTTETNAITLTVSGTAVAGTDYAALPTNIVFAPGVTLTNLSVSPILSGPVGSAKTVVVCVQPGTNYQMGLYTNAVVTLLPPSSITNSVLSPAGRYWRGSGSDPTYWSQVIPLDYETGTVYSNLNGNCSSLYPELTSWLTADYYHYNATNSLSQTNAANRIAFDNPIVAFGERVGGTPLYLGQPYRFGIYSGDMMPMQTPVIISVFYRTNYALAGFINLSVPNAANTNSWNSYVANGFEMATGTNYLSTTNGLVITTNTFGLTTMLSDTPDLNWGALQPGAYVLTHTASSQATNYYYLVETYGWLDSQGQPMVQDTNGYAQPSLLYTLEFEPHPAWRSVFLDQPHFDGNPLPPFYAGMTLAEMLTNTPPVTNAVTITPSAATNLDDSPELRRSPILDNFVASMGNDPIALANYVINQIGLTDPMDYNDDGNIAEQSINPPGVTRGALGTFLEKQGSPVEQCALLVYLLRQAGVPAVYEFAPHNGLQILDARLSRMLKFQVHGGYSEAGQLYTTNTMIPVNYPWVAAYIGTNWVQIFPWLKDYEINEGLDLYDSMPTNYPNAYGWVKDYIYGNTNLLSLAVDGDDTLLVIFPRYLQQALQQNHPGISVDDLGVQIVNRQHYYARWQDFPTPTWVTNVSTSIESLSSGSITNVDPSLTN
ncbi:MAG TPA: choice-of-anchor Q domain-containing protein, partial [Verrucomicrobiae bacterium]|nr:choice-of-anchor Q domain-containing protein [Verrucomicrobiae bacterium]